MNPEQNAFKATRDGAAIYFQNWKTLLKSAGKVLLVTLCSLLVIGGVSFAIFCIAFGKIQLPIYAAELAKAGWDSPQTPLYILFGMASFCVWCIVHGALVKPYILIFVMRAYMEAAFATTPGIDISAKLCRVSRKYRKTLMKAEMAVTPEAQA